MKTASKELKQLYKRQTMLQILIFTMVTIFIWLAFSIFRSQKKTAITAEQNQLAAPLTPNINATVIDQLENKVHFSDQELNDFPIYKIQIDDRNSRTTTPANNPEQINQATPSSSLDSLLNQIPSQPTEQETATQSAQEEN